MSITIREKFDSRLITSGLNPAVELRYVIRGTNLSNEARVTLDVGAPDSYDLFGDGSLLLPRESISLEPVGDELWDGFARYSMRPTTNDSVFSFDTGGGTQHITQSLHTVGRYSMGIEPPDFKGAIGVTADGVEGVDVSVPVCHFSQTHYLPNDIVTPAYRATLFQLTGKVNERTFLGFAEGECLFLGAAGSKRGLGDWELVFRFAASPNVTKLTIGDITGVDKKGWEYLWVRYVDVKDTKALAMVKRPRAVYVEQVYPYADLNNLGVG